MSEKRRRVINVKQLIVNADEVIIRPRRRRRHVDPWLGGRRDDVSPVREREMESSSILEIESSDERESSDRRRFW